MKINKIYLFIFALKVSFYAWADLPKEAIPNQQKTIEIDYLEHVKTELDNFEVEDKKLSILIKSLEVQRCSHLNPLCSQPATLEIDIIMAHKKKQLNQAQHEATKASFVLAAWTVFLNDTDAKKSDGLSKIQELIIAKAAQIDSLTKETNELEKAREELLVKK